jgi:hypothetical protein
MLGEMDDGLASYITGTAPTLSTRLPLHQKRNDNATILGVDFASNQHWLRMKTASRGVLFNEN